MTSPQKRKSAKQLRKFGVTMAVAFGLFAALFWWRDRTWWIYVGGVEVLSVTSPCAP